MSKNTGDSKKISTEPYKGVRDFYPEAQAFLNHFSTNCKMVAERVGYVEYGASILEPSELYKAKGAENEEMVREQTYTFIDRGEREVTLRPEMTPTVARMVAAKRRELGFPLRWYSVANFFRYERPQRGRLREFWQFNLDIFGTHSLAADAEVVAVAYGLMRAFGAKDSDFVIKVGSRVYINELAKAHKLDENAHKKLLALLDKKNKIPTEEFTNNLKELGIPENSLSTSTPPQDIAQMLNDFKSAGITNIVYDPSVVRGFAYYTGMVFEIFDTNPENSRSLCGGGRYDNLTQLFDDEPLPGVGFAMGDETLRLFLESRGLLPKYTPPTKVYIALTDASLATQANTFAGTYLRQKGVSVAIDFGERKLGDQIKTATKHGIPYLVVLGPDELASGKVKVKNLDSGEEVEVGKDALTDYLEKL